MSLFRATLATVTATAAAFWLVACGGGDAKRTALPKTSDPGPVHVHGLGVNPRDDAFFIATHTGLFRLARDSRSAARVADRYQDTMGFTVVGPDRFLGSGHPDGREGLPPFLGLIRSDDAGRTWTSVSLQGKVDFHALEAVGERVYGYGSDWKTRAARFLTSADGGTTWTRLREPEPIASLAISPRDPSVIMAAGERALHVSTDAGRSWRAVDAPTGLVTWPPAGPVVVQVDGTVVGARDATQTWSRRGSIGGEPAAFDSGPDGQLLAARHDGFLLVSRDGGRSWAERFRPPQKG